MHVVADDLAPSQPHRLLMRLHDHHRVEPHQDRDPEDHQPHEAAQQQLVAPGAGDVEPELVVDCFVDRPHDRVGRGHLTEYPGVERRPRHLAGNARAVHVEDEVEDDLSRDDQQQRRDRIEDDVLDHSVVAEEPKADPDRNGEDEQSVAAHVGGTAAQVLPNWLLGHARNESGEDERDRSERQANGHRPTQLTGEVERLVAGQDRSARRKENPQQQCAQQSGEEEADQGHQPLVHENQPPRGHVLLVRPPLEDRRRRSAGGRQLIFLERLEPLELVLVEDDDQAQPHEAAGKHVKGCVREGGVAASRHCRLLGRNDPEDQQDGPHNQLQQQADACHLGRPGIRVVVDSHDPPSGVVSDRTLPPPEPGVGPAWEI